MLCICCTLQTCTSAIWQCLPCNHRCCSVVYQIDVKIAGTTHAFFQRWSACESFHKRLTKDMKLPKGAEFKSDFPTKLKKTLEPDRLEKRKIELDAYFGDLSEWGRDNGMAVRRFSSLRVRERVTVSVHN